MREMEGKVDGEVLFPRKELESGKQAERVGSLVR